MKLKIAAVLGFLAIAAWAVGPYEVGAGKQVTVTTTLQSVTLAAPCGQVSVYNSGTNLVWAIVNSSTNTLAARVAAGTAVPIPAATTFTFDTGGNASIQSVQVLSVNASSVAYLGGF